MAGRKAFLQNRLWLMDDSGLQLGSALLYAVVATSMSLLNRFALLAFPLPSILLLLQGGATLALLGPLLLARVLTFSPWRWTRFVQLFPVAALYTINTALALVSLTGLNLPMYTAIKRLTPMTVLVIKAAWKRRWPPARLTASVGLVVVGCVVAGLGDLAFDAAAYSFALASVVVQAGYLLLVEAQGESGAASTSELLWYTALVALPLLGTVAAAGGDFAKAAPAAAAGLASRGAPKFCFLTFGAASCGVLLNFAMFACTLLNTALTTTIVGVLRGVATVLLGFMYDTVPFSVVNIAGITLNTCGGVWYTWLKYQEKQAAISSRKCGGGGSEAAGAYAKLPGSDEAAAGAAAVSPSSPGAAGGRPDTPQGEHAVREKDTYV